MITIDIVREQSMDRRVSWIYHHILHQEETILEFINIEENYFDVPSQEYIFIEKYLTGQARIQYDSNRNKET